MPRGPWTRDDARRVEAAWNDILEEFKSGERDRLDPIEGPTLMLLLMPAGCLEEDLNVDLPKFFKAIDDHYWAPERGYVGVRYWNSDGALAVAYDGENGRRSHVQFHHTGSIETGIPIHPSNGTVEKGFWESAKEAVIYYADCLSTNLGVEDFYLCYAIVGVGSLEIFQDGKAAYLKHSGYRFYPTHIRSQHVKEDLNSVRMIIENTLGASGYLKK